MLPIHSDLPRSYGSKLGRPPVSLDRLATTRAIDEVLAVLLTFATMADLTFVSRRDSSFKEFPPASAQIAMVLPFYGNMTVWMRTPDAGGWHFPTSARRSGETILEVARRELWDSARIVANRLDLLGAIRYELPKPTTAYVYMCELDRLSWWYELPDKEKCAELGVFAKLPNPIASEAVEIVLEAALRARRTGLR